MYYFLINSALLSVCLYVLPESSHARHKEQGWIFCFLVIDLSEMAHCPL
jgi:hypothetical protein